MRVSPQSQSSLCQRSISPSPMMSAHYFFYALAIVSLPLHASGINWNGNWAFACDFPGNNLVSVMSTSNACASICDLVTSCTHYAWTPVTGGTCWLKFGVIPLAVDSFEPGIICGISPIAKPTQGLFPPTQVLIPPTEFLFQQTEVLVPPNRFLFPRPFPKTTTSRPTTTSGTTIGPPPRGTTFQPPNDFTTRPRTRRPPRLRQDGSPSDSDDCGAFALEGLERHNELRAKHNSPPLVLKKEICDWAQEWANQLANDGFLHHRQDNKYGENIFQSSGETSANEAVQLWYDEIAQYTFGSGFSPETGHFTQVVWKSSTELGMAQAVDSQGQTFIVANYNPPGNFEGEFPDNVLPPT